MVLDNDQESKIYFQILQGVTFTICHLSIYRIEEFLDIH